MKKEQKETANTFLSKWEKLSDSIVALFYNETLVNKVESLDFMKKLINSSFIASLQDFWKWWFKSIFIFFWYLAIVFWLLSFVIEIFDLFGSFRYYRWLLSIILWMGMSILFVINWFWMIKFKSRYPFVFLITYIYKVLFYLIFDNYWYMYYWAWSSVGYLLFSLLFFILWYALILKNKELFKN